MYFPNLDPTTFYDNDDYALTNYVSDPPSDELIHSIKTNCLESELTQRLGHSFDLSRCGSSLQNSKIMYSEL